MAGLLSQFDDSALVQLAQVQERFQAGVAQALRRLPQPIVLEAAQHAAEQAQRAFADPNFLQAAQQATDNLGRAIQQLPQPIVFEAVQRAAQQLGMNVDLLAERFRGQLAEMGRRAAETLRVAFPPPQPAFPPVVIGRSPSKQEQRIRALQTEVRQLQSRQARTNRSLAVVEGELAMLREVVEGEPEDPEAEYGDG